jgi:hypothetical protein
MDELAGGIENNNCAANRAEGLRNLIECAVESTAKELVQL